MNIGKPERIIEIEPVVVPIPEPLPAEEPVGEPPLSDPEPELVPAEPERPEG